MSFSQAEENYIKSIYNLNENNKLISTNELASYLNTKASSITDMVKKLSDKKVVEYQKYHGVRLTSKGKKIATQVIRKHRLWEVFLVKILEFNWAEIHDIAEQLEHIDSPELINRLDQFLGYPKVDPHGDPIPDENGKFREKSLTKLMSSLSLGDTSTICGVKDESNELLKYLIDQNIKLGTDFKVVNSFSFDESIEIETANGERKNLSKIVTDNIYVEGK